MSALTASDLDDVGALKEKLVPFIMGPNTYLAQEPEGGSMGSCPHTYEVNPRRHVRATKVPYLTHRMKNKMAAASLLPFTSLTEILPVALETHYGGDSGKCSSAWPS